MLNIRKLSPNIVIELRYATKRNFTGKTLYTHTECYLNEPAAKRLARVQKNLEKKKLGLKVWDCYRPLDVQKELWKVVPDSRYVADPKHGSRHNRGASVDLTLVDDEGNELPMPTEFDDFSKKAHRDYMDHPKNLLRNRDTLQKAMEAEGFLGLPTEWWHFDDPEWKRFAIRNDPISSSKLKMEKKTPGVESTLPSQSEQLVLVISKGWNAKRGTLRRFEKKKGKWKRVGSAWPVTLGRKGMAWGQGRQISLLKGPHKREGDKRSPAGMFKIGQGYGYAKQQLSGMSWPYTPVTKQWRCVDDPKSSHYNQIINLDDVLVKDWKSAEKMKRTDHQYRWVVNIEQNYPNVLKGSGSCIFFHVWRKAKSPTIGCTAMKEKHMVTLMKWLDPWADPYVVQLPKGVFKQVRRKWKLP